jgi:hypothetical protein
LIAKSASLSESALKSSIIWYTTLEEDGNFLRLLGRGMKDAQLVLMLAEEAHAVSYWRLR